ncbi:protein PRRC1-like [Actinia tenebrosa]|uniref:Protein PRRC1-like n=1 Tax=Actinia tenebrosa TaxID=6105 RepID=A0A6P8HYT2_ACTTE|nr:protein PRRC1-like [Actinia tenebrosa]
MMQPHGEKSLNMESNEPDSKVDIVKEVASALEDEDVRKDEPKPVSRLPSTTTSATTAEQKQPTTSSPVTISKGSSPSQPTPSSSSKILASPPQERIRSEPTPAQKTPSTAASGVGTENSSTTWQSTTQSSDDGGGMWGWMSSAVTAGLQTTQNIGRNIVEKTKSSVDTVITTLDPAMEDYLHNRSQGVNLVLTTEHMPTIEAIKDGFRQIFELAFFKGLSSASSIAPLPTGCSAGLKGAQHRVSHLRRTKKVKEDEIVIGVEELVAELIPGKWFSMFCLYLNDPNLKIDLQTFSQALEVPKEYISKAEQSTPSNYNLRWSGLSYTLGEVVLGTGNSQGDWQTKVGGCSRKQILTMASKNLAGQYKTKCNEKIESVMDKAVVL